MAKGAGSILKMMMVTTRDILRDVRTWRARSSPAVEERTYPASAGGPERRCPGGRGGYGMWWPFLTVQESDLEISSL